MFLLFFVAALAPLVSHPTFCGMACHSQNPEWQAWKKSSHARITCYACHMNKGSFSHLLELKVIEGPKGMIMTALGTDPRPNNPDSEVALGIPMERCERCHTNENRKFTFSRGIWMDHLKHKEAGINCPVCHNRVAHAGAEEFEPLKSEWDVRKGFKYKNFLTMKQGCFRCHSINPNEETLHLIQNGKKPPTACTTCHTEDFDLPVGHGTPDWRSKHKIEAKKDFGVCGECHSGGAKFDNEGKAWCTVCHDDAKVSTFKGIILGEHKEEGGEEASEEGSSEH